MPHHARDVPIVMRAGSPAHRGTLRARPPPAQRLPRTPDPLNRVGPPTRHSAKPRHQRESTPSCTTNAPVIRIGASPASPWQQQPTPRLSTDALQDARTKHSMRCNHSQSGPTEYMLPFRTDLTPRVTIVHFMAVCLDLSRSTTT